MSYNINKDLVQAYQKVVINEVAFKAEFIYCVHEELINQGYNLTESDVEQICLSERVNWASLGRMISRATSAAGGVRRGVSTAAREFAQGARVQRAAERVRRGQQAAQQTTPRRSDSERLGAIVSKIISHPFTKGAAATFMGTSAIGDLRSGGGGLRTVASWPVSAIGGGTKGIGYLSGNEGIRQTGRDIETLGSMIKGDQTQSQQSPTPQEPKKKELKRFTYDDQGNITGIAESYSDSEDEDIQLYNYVAEVLQFLISEGVVSLQENLSDIVGKVSNYLYESEKELVMLNNKPGIMIPDPNNPGKKKWQAIDPKTYPNYEKMMDSYIRRRGEGQVKQDVKTAQEMEAAQKKAREEKAKQPKPPEPKPEEKTEAKPEEKTEAKPEEKTEAKPEEKTEAKPEEKTEAKPEAKTEAKPEAKAAPTTADYMKAASAARKSGDPAEMAKARDMGLEIWKKANPKLAAAQAERERIRGTAQTDNPLMQDMKSRMSLTPSVQSSTLKKDLGNLAGGHSRLVNNPNAAIAATPKPEEKKTDKSDKDKATSYVGTKPKPVELNNKVSVGEKGSNPYKK